MATDAILFRMRAAQVPTFAYTTSLKLEKQLALAEIVKGREFERGEAGLKSYLITRHGGGVDSKVCRTCAAFAKELVLAGTPVYCTSVEELSLASTMYERGVDSIYTFAERVGEGYLVLCDYNECGVETTQLGRVQMILLSHISRGGAVILGTVSELSLLTMEFQESVAKFEAVAI